LTASTIREEWRLGTSSNPELVVRRILLSAIVSLSFVAAIHAQPGGGVLPVGGDGKPLNLDFETGTLKDWTATGDAFKGQPIKGDTVAPRRGDMRSNHQGQYWIGGYEGFGDKPQGTLTSVPFKVTHPWASFLVGGGPHETTCVELVRKDTGAVFHRVSGNEDETMHREAVDLAPHQGKEIFIRLVDKHSGGWGHINFDDFRFHTEKPKTPPRKSVPTPDTYKYAGLPPEKAAQVMTVPEGFDVTLFAGEPDVRQPIAFCIDDRGRLWVAEAYSYPIRRPDKQAKDRILIFEDTKGTGHFDKRTVFIEGLNLVSGIEVGFGGVWVGAAPYLLYIPIKPGTDEPAGPPQVLLDGWGYQDTHETLNTFTWGPDGWLYGCHGVFTHSKVGKPGTPPEQRVGINAGVWRYHPTRHVFEVFAHGTSNPWGLDFNDYGQAFVEACVIPHAFHVIHNARYHRQGGEHFNPYTFDDIKTIADHRHYLGATPHGGNNRSDGAGGGHAHCGTMIYLGGAWPSEYRGQMFMGNIHGRRINMDILTPKGSGYVAGHGPDFLLANDAWARFINFQYGPDGNVYVIDWYDKQACHTNKEDIWDRTNGRIYKVSRRGTKFVRPDLAKLSDGELINLLWESNDWYVRHARRLLQERKVWVGNATAFRKEEESRRLRWLWAIHVTTGLTDDDVRTGLADAGPYVRGWTIQLALDGGPNGPREASRSISSEMVKLSRTDPSPVVRLYLAAESQRLPLDDRWDLLDGLVSHAEDAGDHNLPLMYWYAAEPLAGVDPSRALALARKAKVPPILAFMVRRIGSTGTPEAIQTLAQAVAKEDDVAMQRTFLRGLTDALKGRRQVPMPPAWSEAYAKLSKSGDAEVRRSAEALSVTFGDAKAFAQMRTLLADRKADVATRQQALTSLVAGGAKDLAGLLQELVAEPPMRAAALRGLAAYDDARTPQVILGVFASLSSDEKRDALNTLAARTPFARAMLDAVAAKKLAAADIPADVVRQVRNLRDADLDKRLGDVWGTVRVTPADRLKMIADYKRKLTTKTPDKPDVAVGRAVFAKTCQQCHMLFGVGGKVGPDITGSNRANLDYLLENILDPSAVIPKEYAASIVALADGRVVTGIVKNATPTAYAIVLPGETLTVGKADVESIKTSDVSMMPDDLLKTLSDAEVHSLIAYLQSPRQTEILARPDNVKEFFNGKDLTGWDGDPKLWRVDNGEIIGSSPGIKRNEFLRSQMIASDFRLRLKVKLTPDKENSGVQFRSESLPGGEVKGPQADVGKGWWGKLYEEHGRGLVWSKSGEEHVKVDDWNDYEILAEGSRVKTWINGKQCVDLDDPMIARRGIFAFQIHSGGAMEVRFKELRLEILPLRKESVRD
jgi:putative membrane-bound dehydrogenase-like protein